MSATIGHEGIRCVPAWAARPNKDTAMSENSTLPLPIPHMLGTSVCMKMQMWTRGCIQARMPTYLPSDPPSQRKTNKRMITETQPNKKHKTDKRDRETDGRTDRQTASQTDKQTGSVSVTYITEKINNMGKQTIGCCRPFSLLSHLAN